MKIVLIFLFGIFIGKLLFSRFVYDKSPKIIEETVIKNIGSNIKNINNGGCGFFAYKLYQCLDKKRYEIVDIEDMRHICILDKVTRLYIDAFGYHSKFEMQVIFGEKTYCIETITEDSLHKMLYKDCWNKKFNKSDTILIDSMIKRL